jgi:hypothetical protein
MFGRKTVFIVGAGASKELKLPIGNELTALIASKLAISFENGQRQTTGSQKIFDAVRMHCQEMSSREEINLHIHAGRDIASAMPQAISIDNFLHTHSHDERIILMGKLAISECILEAEKNSHIRGEINGQKPLDFRTVPDSWHNTFCKMLGENVQRITVEADLKALFNNVAFISFNYDRCIEHYITQWLKNYMKLPDPNAALKHLQIYHPYGQVGPLVSQGQQYSYGMDPTPSALLRIANQIHTFTEQVEDNDDELGRMRQTVAEAKNVVYLGFSFNPMNMKLLQVGKKDPTNKNVFATTLGLSAANVNVHKGDIVKSIGETMTTATLHLEGSTCLGLMNDYWHALTRG